MRTLSALPTLHTVSVGSFREPFDCDLKQVAFGRSGRAAYTSFELGVVRSSSLRVPVFHPP